MWKKISVILITIGVILLLLAGVMLIYNMLEDSAKERKIQQILKDIRENPDDMEYDAIGILTIPKLGLELPVLSDCNESLLEVSVCRYLGKVEKKPEGLVIAGHNSNTCFKRLPKIEVGDEVCFTTIEGIEYNYTVSQIKDISKDESQELEQGWDLTLFTCTPDGEKRVLVRCSEKS